MLNKKALMICEKSNSDLEVSKSTDSKKYILEGIFAEFGKKNNNGRIYEEDEYMPHLEALQKQLKEGKITLLGELDHPKDFETTLERASHVIEKLEYMPDKRQVWGRIRLLNTPKGQLAKGLVDDGVILNVSSRAAGNVNEGGIVSIKKIFTWDLVANPGFQNAQVHSVNESLGFSKDEDIQIFETDYLLSDILRNTNIKSEKNTNTMTSNNDVHSLVENILMKKELVDANELEAYSQEVNNVLNTLNEKLEEVTKQLKKHEVFNNYLGAKAENFENKVSEISESSSLLEKIDELNERIVDLEDHNDYLLSKVKVIAEHQDEIVNIQQENNQEIEKNIYKLNEEKDQFVEYFGKIRNKHNELVKTFENFVTYNDKVVETINGRNAYYDEVVETINGRNAYYDQVVETINARNEYQDKVNRTLDHRSRNGVVNESVNENLNESNTTIKNIIKTTKDSQKLLDKIDLLIESVNTQNTQKVVSEFNSPYLNLLSEQNLNYFMGLNENQKQMILEDVSNKRPFTEREVLSIIQENLNPTSTEKFEDVLLASMPGYMKPTWDNLTKTQQNMYLLEANNYNLSTPALRENFWNTRKSLKDTAELQLLTESFDPIEEKSRVEEGYLSDTFTTMLDRQLSKYRN